MITRIRLVVLLTRPAVILLLIMFNATGAAEAGPGGNASLLAAPLAAVVGFLLFSVACNDLADEAIDRVNLPGRRPLAAGLLGRREFAIIGVTAGAGGLAASALLGWRAVVVMAGGMCVSAGYSLRPVRLADRGAVASLVLPGCYVAVPYLLGVLAVDETIHPEALLLLAGLYLGFVGRILLKDFRDVRGDALFGKRTFLVRHGRVPTCVFSACFWMSGTAVILAGTARLTVALAAAEVTCLACALASLRALSADRGARRDESIVAAVAIIGRGMVLLLLAHLSMAAAGWTQIRYDVVIAGLLALTVGQARSMARHGPVSRLRVPGWLQAGSEPAGQLGSPDHDPGAVAAEQVACEFERQSRARVGGAFDQHQRRSFGDAERLGFPDARADWLQALLGPVRPLPVLLIEQLVQRPVQAVAEQARAAFGREEGVLDQDRLAACQAQPPYLVDRGARVDLQRGCRGGAGADFGCGEDPGSRD